MIAVSFTTLTSLVNRIRVSALERTGQWLIPIVLVAVILCQIWLIFQKAINWDEFLHFGQIYELADGRLSGSLQSLHVRLFGWAALVAQDVITQIQVARIAMLACALLTMGCVIHLARRLVDRETAFLTGLIYLTAGFVFTNSFTYRPDPVAAAALMGALCLLVSGSFSWKRVILSGILVGLAGALTIKSIFYAPCFAAAVYLKWHETTGPRSSVIYRSAVLLAVAIGFFLMIVGLHGSTLATSSTQGSSLAAKTASFLRFFEFEQIRYVFAEMALAPLLTLGLILLIPVARGLPGNVKVLLLGLCGPLLCILFYRNTFPYFFTFLLPPVCVAIAPVLVKLVGRYGLGPVIILSLLGPAFLLVNEPYGTLERQRATINEVERLFPEPTPYLSYSSYMPEYPRQFRSLISGIALGRYWKEREGQIARDIEDGRIAFVIATGNALNLVYQHDGPAPLLPERDVAALRSNFLRHSDTIFIAGKNVCSQRAEQKLRIFRSGVYSVDGGGLVIDGQYIADRKSVSLAAGTHMVRHKGTGCVKLWALDHIPELPEDFPEGPIAGGF
ncbi:dolichyl-phosphate-mannose-protein mannosyltransferase [Sphingorhabdus sp. SMR4y]|nr:dolichyl-phosphate-mannose-protein mannosyltransferase [Sphingorhabdus sp. SMR4y]